MASRRSVIVRIAAVAIVTTVALAGCVGIPTGGGVNQGQVIKDQDNFPFALVPSGPQKDATRAEILTDFMQAATSPEGDYTVAKQFLTPVAAKSWKPNQSVLIREGVGTLISRGTDIIDYSVSTRSSVNAFGLYKEDTTASTQQLEYTFSKVDGQWRISALPDGTVLSRDTFNSVFDEHALYYFDPSYHFLVPDVRWFPARSSLATRIVGALLAGQASWLQQGATLSAFPQGTQLATPVDIKSGLATVDLTDEAGVTNNQVRARMLQQLLTSLGTVSVNTVTMTVRAVPLQVADPTASNATRAPTVDPAALIRKGNRFGFSTGAGITSIDKLSPKILGVNPGAVTLGRDQSSAAVLGTGGVYLVTADAAAPLLVDNRKRLIAPSIDNSRYVWTVPSNNASALRATGPDGIPHSISSNLPRGADIVALNVSRDGARVLIYLRTAAGARLEVAAILRRDGVPTALGELLELPVSSDTPIDATWVDENTVATLATAVTGSVVTSYQIGGPQEPLGRATGGIRIVGGNGADEIRVLTADGTILQRRASGWQSTGIKADLLATQQ